MVNKRFNRKFRRALGAALGALSVASISNVDVVNAVLTESVIDADPQLRYFFRQYNTQKRNLWIAIDECFHQIRYNDKKTWIFKKHIPALGNVSFAFPEQLQPNNLWMGYNCTVKIPRKPCVRICLLKVTDPDLGQEGYLLTPPLTYAEFAQFTSNYQLPELGSWLSEGLQRNAAFPPSMLPPLPPPPGWPGTASKARFITNAGHYDAFLGVITHANSNWAPDAGVPATVKNFRYQRRKFLETRYDPTQPPPVIVGLNGVNVAPDADYLTNWEDIGLAYSPLWDKSLKGGASLDKMFGWTLDKCPQELRDFYYPPKKEEEPLIFSNSNSTPVSLDSNASTMNTATMAAIGLSTAAAIAPALTGNGTTTNTTGGSTTSPVNSLSDTATPSATQVQSTENSTIQPKAEGNTENTNS